MLPGHRIGRHLLLCLRYSGCNGLLCSGNRIRTERDLWPSGGLSQRGRRGDCRGNFRYLHSERIHLLYSLGWSADRRI